MSHSHYAILLVKRVRQSLSCSVKKILRTDACLSFVLPLVDAVLGKGASTAKVGVNVVESITPCVAEAVDMANLDAFHTKSAPKVRVPVFALSILVNSAFHAFGREAVGIFEM
ncbi:hypothetical protein E4U41_005785 [Claviceps citrina]|nr:hypothetical protein E4U41_005785 [Claviceps citrina]